MTTYSQLTYESPYFQIHYIMDKFHVFPVDDEYRPTVQTQYGYFKSIKAAENLLEKTGLVGACDCGGDFPHDYAEWCHGCEEIYCCDPQLRP